MGLYAALVSLNAAAPGAARIPHPAALSRECEYARAGHRHAGASPVRWNRSMRTASRNRSEKVPALRFEMRPNRQVRYVSGIE
ncbi:hypothetical protein CFB46_12795 [Burkholderia sp. HI2761]|uniref:hypothetical protein n=1 Tax=Burkholderia sp. BE24 TaxID=2656643 RepID=UPI000B7A797A|nr:hypothetical protein [Burkholderia sp. BE24]MPV55737.1 hypothetical protein [Burkholderia sp. BE24]OXJ27574.1 hypothetical protein CFB46_12795 [Burkholderia sp. HI2761]